LLGHNLPFTPHAIAQNDRLFAFETFDPAFQILGASSQDNKEGNEEARSWM
jgi:hypothetical protein